MLINSHHICIRSIGSDSLFVFLILLLRVKCSRGFCFLLRELTSRRSCPERQSTHPCRLVGPAIEESEQYSTHDFHNCFQLFVVSIFARAVLTFPVVQNTGIDFILVR